MRRVVLPKIVLLPQLLLIAVIINTTTTSWFHYCNASSSPRLNFQLAHKSYRATRLHKIALLSDKILDIAPTPAPPREQQQQQQQTPLQQHYTTNVTNNDIEAIQTQLGYIPSNLLSVSARRGGTTIGTPLALKTYPLNGGANRRKAKARGMLTPFPTLYWFCCPIVGKAIADLERRGFVGDLERRLRLGEEGGSSSSLRQFVRSHEGYASERWETLSEYHRDMLDNNLEGTNNGMRDMVKYSGIAGTDYKSFGISVSEDLNVINMGGGIKQKSPSIKCLHAHYAHYRSQVSKVDYKDTDEGINIVGQWTHQVLQEEFPDLIL